MTSEEEGADSDSPELSSNESTYRFSEPQNVLTPDSLVDSNLTLLAFGETSTDSDSDSEFPVRGLDRAQSAGPHCGAGAEGNLGQDRLSILRNKTGNLPPGVQLLDPLPRTQRTFTKVNVVVLAPDSLADSKALSSEIDFLMRCEGSGGALVTAFSDKDLYETAQLYFIYPRRLEL